MREGRASQSELPIGSTLHPDGTITFPAVGHCIYCNAVGELTKEHIVPFGLNGNMTLPEASCGACQKITSDIERFILREQFGLWREKFGIKSRNRKKSRSKNRKPKESSINIIGSLPPENIPLRPEDFPAMLYLPHWGTSMLGWVPGMEQPPVADELIVRFLASDAENLLELATGRSYQIGSLKFDKSIFARFLAKIAYSFAYAALGGLPTKSDLPAIILNEDLFFRHRIGSEKVRASAGSLWSVGLGIAQLRDGSNWVGAHVDFLTPFDFPRYEILICRVSDSEFTLPTFSHYSFGLKVQEV